MNWQVELVERGDPDEMIDSGPMGRPSAIPRVGDQVGIDDNIWTVECVRWRPGIATVIVFLSAEDSDTSGGGA